MKLIVKVFTLLVLIQLATSYRVCQCGINEYYGEGGMCDGYCVTYGQGCPIQTILPVKRCICYDGYARDNFGVCVPLNECP